MLIYEEKFLQGVKLRLGGAYLFEQGEVDPSWENVWIAKCKRKRELGSWEEVDPGLR